MALNVFGGRYARQQPQQLAKVNPGSSLARGLLCAVVPHQRADAFQGRLYTQDGTYAISNSAAGVGLRTDGSASSIWVPINSIALTQWTLFGVFQSNGNAIDTRAMSLGSSTSTSPIIQIGASTSNAARIRMFARTNGDVTPTEAQSVASAFDATLHTVAMVYDGANLTCYIDGKLDSTNALASATFTVDRFCVGALRRSTTSGFWAGSTFMGAAWKRNLSSAEVMALHQNPWQMFPAEGNLLPMVDVPGGATDTPVNPGVGALSLTGYAPTVAQTANQSVAPGVGSLTLTGYAPTVVVTANQSVTPDVGAITITGYAPTVTQSSGANILPSAGALTLTGYAPAVVQTAHQSIAPGVGAMTITGHAPTVDQTTTPAEVRYARPDSDISAGSWLPSSGSDLYAMIDEVAPDDADYIYTNSASTCELGLQPVEDPGTSTGQAVRYQVWSDSGDGITVSLKQGAATIASWSHPTLPTTPTVYEQFLTVAECDSITDYTDLRLEFEAL